MVGDEIKKQETDAFMTDNRMKRKGATRLFTVFNIKICLLNDINLSLSF